MNNVMGEYIDNFVLVYLHDILMFSTTEYEHEYRLRLVFQKLREHKLQAKLKKCEFGKPRIKYLGYIVAQGRYMWIRIRLLQLLIGKHLRISKESSSFWVLPTITIVGIPDFAKVAAPLSNLLSNPKEFKWTSD